MSVATLFLASIAASIVTPQSNVVQGVAPVVTRSLSGSQMLGLASEFLRRGAVANAAAILELLARDRNPDVRNEARFRLAKILAATGQNARAAVLLRQIIDERPNAVPARLELARVLDQMGDKEGAWRQVRAAQASGLPPAVARLVDRYSEALRAQRPFGASIEIAVAPDSNINRATSSSTLGTVLGDFDIAKGSRARSGIGLSLRSQVFRRVSVGGGKSVLFRLTGFADLYGRAEFNDIAADLAVGPELELGPGRLQLEAGATQQWFGQKQFERSARLAATVSRPIGGRTFARISAAAAIVDNEVNDLQDGRRYSSQLSIERSLTPETGIAATLSLDRESLKDPGYSTFEWRIGLTGWRDLGRLTLTSGAEVGTLHSDKRLMLFPQKRGDRYLRFSLGATFRQLQFGGFAPIARLSFERNRSSLAFYDYHRIRTEMGIVRAF